jgi:hypothetical protein
MKMPKPQLLFKMLALAGGFEAHPSKSNSTRMVMTPSIKTKRKHNIQRRIKCCNQTSNYIGKE